MKASALLLLFSFVSFISYAQEEDFGSIFTLWYEQPANEWDEGKFDGVCARGGFELSFEWKDKKLTEVYILSKAGEKCRINIGSDCEIISSGKRVGIKKIDDGIFEFETEAGALYNVVIG
ncbi:MAG: glycoside hydrolase family 95-like protein [Bacteroidota bacterium]